MEFDLSSPALKAMNDRHAGLIDDLEVKKHSLYLNFVFDLSSKMLVINDPRSREFLERYLNQFSEI